MRKKKQENPEKSGCFARKIAQMEKGIEKELLNLRIDDLPLLYAIIKQLKIGKTIDKHLLVYGNWLGALPGQLIELWLSYMLSIGCIKVHKKFPYFLNPRNQTF